MLFLQNKAKLQTILTSQVAKKHFLQKRRLFLISCTLRVVIYTTNWHGKYLTLQGRFEMAKIRFFVCTSRKYANVHH